MKLQRDRTREAHWNLESIARLQKLPGVWNNANVIKTQ